MALSKTFAFSLLVVSAVFAAPVIKITSDTPIQQTNLVKNGGFEEQDKYWRRLPAKVDGSQFSFGKYDGCTGENCLKITGNESLALGVMQRIPFKPVLAAGEPLLLSMRICKKDTDSELKKWGSVALHATWDKSALKPGEPTAKYLPTFEFIREDHDWVYRYVEVPPQDKPITEISLYLCFYNVVGVCAFDDVALYRGAAKVTVEVTGNDARELKVVHSLRGTLLNEKLTGGVVKTLDVPAYGAVGVCVTSADGRSVWKSFPENVDANQSNAENVLPLGAVNRYFLSESHKKQSFLFEKPVIPEGKKAYLVFDARANANRIAGHSAILRLIVNGKTLSERQIVGPYREFTSSTGRVYKINGNSSYLLFYSPVAVAINEENSYCPVTVPSKNPFAFKVDLSEVLKDGINEVTFFNSARFNQKYKPVDIVENPKVVIE